MRNPILILVVIFGLNVSEAASLFKNPGQWLKDTGDAAREDTTRIIREGANVMTLGELNRQRDRERAEQQKREAARARAAAEALKKEKIKQSQQRLTHLNEVISLLKGNIKNLGFLQQSMVTHLTSIDKIINALESTSAEHEILVEVTWIQYRDLEQWFDAITEKAFEDPQLEEARLALIDKFEFYHQQITGIPEAYGAEEKAEIYWSSLEEGELILASVHNLTASLEAKLKESQEQMVAEEKSLQALKK